MVLIIQLYIKTQREVQFLPSYSHIYDHIAFANFYGLMVYFTTFCIIFNIFTYSNDLGGGYVVKTYPSIDPIAAPPPPPDIISI